MLLSPVAGGPPPEAVVYKSFALASPPGIGALGTNIPLENFNQFGTRTITDPLANVLQPVDNQQNSLSWIPPQQQVAEGP